jgi:O-antigen/teichoic acid export membrane protein
MQLPTIVSMFLEKVKSKNLGNFLRLLTIDSLVKVSGLILLPVYLQLMDQNEFGLYGYLVAMVAYLATILNGGFYLVQSKLYFEYPESQRGQVLFTLNSLLFGFMLLIVILWIALNLDAILVKRLFNHPIDFSLFRVPLVVGVFTTAFGLMVSQYLLASGSIKKLQIFNILRSFLIHVIVLFAFNSRTRMAPTFVLLVLTMRN